MWQWCHWWGWPHGLADCWSARLRSLCIIVCSLSPPLSYHPINIRLPQCRFISPTWFDCLNSVLSCPPLLRPSYYSAFSFKIHFFLIWFFFIYPRLIFNTWKLDQTWNTAPTCSLISYFYSSVTFDLFVLVPPIRMAKLPKLTLSYQWNQTMSPDW